MGLFDNGVIISNANGLSSFSAVIFAVWGSLLSILDSDAARWFPGGGCLFACWKCQSHTFQQVLFMSNFVFLLSSQAGSSIVAMIGFYYNYNVIMSKILHDGRC